MNIKKSNEELIEALAEAAGAAFASLKENKKEHFYFYVFVFDEGLHPYISAWSYEALEKSGGNGTVQILPMLLMGMTNFLEKQMNCWIKEQTDYQMMSFTWANGKHGSIVWKKL